MSYYRVHVFFDTWRVDQHLLKIKICRCLLVERFFPPLYSAIRGQGHSSNLNVKCSTYSTNKRPPLQHRKSENCQSNGGGCQRSILTLWYWCRQHIRRRSWPTRQLIRRSQIRDFLSRKSRSSGEALTTKTSPRRSRDVSISRLV